MAAAPGAKINNYTRQPGCKVNDPTNKNYLRLTTLLTRAIPLTEVTRITREREREGEREVNVAEEDGEERRGSGGEWKNVGG